MGKVLGNYDAPALLALLQEYGVGRVLRSRGFLGPDLAIDDRSAQSDRKLRETVLQQGAAVV
jgi:hypothetical protein